ncbi:uncharacterized protein C8A04DRAFT_12908 [Dichotomopilus funicola]|uniref:BZIP domain-containing protein n=1 Tax=Dichotomopilus funicola TaxID=1934379 RepID=A0AAN6V3C1_9PEZI|nr:hypothetical protein C8A04DRAFT_12908 [Dichotomopilus funicola]
MSSASYNNTGRVNVSQYLRNLNVQGPSVEETLTDEDLEKDLALFTNTQFFDFETGQHTDYQAPPVKSEVTRSPTEDVSSESIMGDFPAGYEFPVSGPPTKELQACDFSFGDYNNTFASPTVPAFPDALGGLQPIQPNPQSGYPSQVPHQQHHQANGYVQQAAPAAVRPRASGSLSSVAGGSSSSGSVEERKAESISGHAHAPNGRVLSFEDASRLAAEEDKRKRNTAASARFRIKKKQREQALEKSAKEMTEKVTMLEGRISALETENKWLKGLVTEKHGGRDDILDKLLKEVASQENGKDSISVAAEIKSKRKD